MFARRDIMKGAATLPLAAILADPLLARAAAEMTEDVTLTLDDGQSATAAVIYPEVTPAPAVLLIHEWWGLNDQIKAVAAELAREGYVAAPFAVKSVLIRVFPGHRRPLASSAMVLAAAGRCMPPSQRPQRQRLSIMAALPGMRLNLRS